MKTLLWNCDVTHIMCSTTWPLIHTFTHGTRPALEWKKKKSAASRFITKRNLRKSLFFSPDLWIPAVFSPGRHRRPRIHISAMGRALVWSKVKAENYWRPLPSSHTGFQMIRLATSGCHTFWVEQSGYIAHTVFSRRHTSPLLRHRTDSIYSCVETEK